MAYHSKNISELFGYRQNDVSEKAVRATKLELCPFTSHRCTKTSHDRKNVYGVCSVSAGETHTNKSDVIVCPKRFYGLNYEILRGVTRKIWGADTEFVAGGDIHDLREKLSMSTAKITVVAFGSDSGKEIRLGNKRRQSIDWILQAYAGTNGTKTPNEFVAVEVQSTDIIGNYRENQSYFRNVRLGKSSKIDQPPNSRHGLNWANVYKRLIPQMISKGSIYRESERCVGFFVITCSTVLARIMNVIGNPEHKPTFSPENVSILTYSLGNDANHGRIRTLHESGLVHFSLDDIIKGFCSNQTDATPIDLDQVLRNIL